MYPRIHIYDIYVTRSEILVMRKENEGKRGRIMTGAFQ